MRRVRPAEPYRHRATEFGRRVRADDGAAAVLALITQLDGERGHWSS